MDLINWEQPDETDLKKAFDKMSEEEFHAYRKWYISQKMHVAAEPSIRKGFDWIIDIRVNAIMAETEMFPFDEAEKIVTVVVSRSFDDDSSATKKEVVGKFIVKVNDPGQVSGGAQ